MGDWYGVDTDGDGRVVGLRLYENGLSGTIPSELGNLANLQTLSLFSNQLSGEIPAELGNLANLQMLSLFGNQLSGEIPAELGNLANLQELWLSMNQLSGKIPAELGNLANLQMLQIFANELSGKIPSDIGNLDNLLRLSLSDNQLIGEIPRELGAPTQIESLALFDNQLSGEIPVELADLTNLQSLLLSGNQLSGEIPAELGNLANLKSLWLHYNQLSGEIPPELGRLTNLQSLHLSRNQLTGEIPSGLGNIAKLDVLGIYNNQLSGEIPPQLGSLTNLRWLLLSGNQLTGNIPAELGNLVNLELLWLSGNQLEGCIPPGLRGVDDNDLGLLELPFCSTSGDWVGNVVTGVRVEATPNAPNTVAKWVVQFQNGTIRNMDHAQTDGGNTINTNEENNILNGGTGADVIMIEFEDDVQFPEAVSPVSPNDVVITANIVWDGQAVERTVVANPLGVDIIKVSEFAGSLQRTDRPPDEMLVTLEIPDMEPSDDRPGFQGIAPGATVTVVFRQSAGIKNPTESKPDEVDQAERAAAVDANGNFNASLLKPLSGYKVQVATSNNGYFVPARPGNRAVIPRRLVLSDMDGPRGSTITVVGLGFRNSLTATIWNDKGQNGAIDSGEIDLGAALITGSDDFTATITINNPPFNHDLDTNGINAVDGRNRTIIPGRRYTGALSGFTATESIPKYFLESSFKVNPRAAAVGDRVQVTARDFVPGGNIAHSQISISGVPVTDYEATVVSSTGEAAFEMTIPSGVASGTQELVIKDGPDALFNPSHDIVNTGGARFNMVITWGQISMIPSHGLVPNQTVTLVGRGFSTGGAARINVTGSHASISGDDTDLRPPSEKLNEGNPIEVDNAGNWASSFVIPVTDVTTTPGDHELSITDTEGGSSLVVLNMAERQLTLTPWSARVGTRVDIKGSGFPADNPDEGADATVTVKILYLSTGSSRTVATLTPDGSGNIRGWFTVPLVAWIPSVNAVLAEFEIPATGATVTTSTVHEVTRASIALDKESGPAGTVVTITGDGFKSNTSVSEINFGALDVRYDVSLSTNGEGAFETTFVVPSVKIGPQAVTVRVGETIASAAFTVTEDPILPGAPVISAPIIAGDRSLTVTWRAPIETRRLTPIGYDLRYIPTDADETVEANWTLEETIRKIGFEPLEYVLTGLTSGTKYDVQLRAVNAVGTSSWSATATGTPSTWGAVRYLSETYVEPGGEVLVAIIATGYGLYGYVVETLPPGFSYAGSSLNEDAVIVSGRDVIFFLSGQEEFIYTVTAPGAAREHLPTPTPTPRSGAALERQSTPMPTPTPMPRPRRRRGGEHSFFGFFGNIVNENRLQQTVGGAASVRVGVEPLVNAVSFGRGMVRIDSPIPVAVIFSGPVSGFTVEDVVVSNGVASNFADSGAVYTFDVTPNAIGEVTVDIIADAATDAEGNGNMAAPTLLLGIPYDDDHDGEIDKDEANAAVADYFAGQITREQAIAVVILYFLR